MFADDHIFGGSRRRRRESTELEAGARTAAERETGATGVRRDANSKHASAEEASLAESSRVAAKARRADAMCESALANAKRD